jgi:hypothetical protein
MICRSEGETMTETEKMLRKELMKYELQNEELKRKLKVANDANYSLYQQTQELSWYIRQMEKAS